MRTRQKQKFDRSNIKAIANEKLKQDEEYQYWTKLYDKLWDDRWKFGETTMKELFYTLLDPIEEQMEYLERAMLEEVSSQYEF